MRGGDIENITEPYEGTIEQWLPINCQRWGEVRVRRIFQSVIEKSLNYIVAQLKLFDPDRKSVV